MKRVLYRLPDGDQIVQALLLWEDERKSLLFVPPVPNLLGPAIVIAERQENRTFEDSADNAFPVNDWSASMIAILLMLLVKENALYEPMKFD